MKTLRMIGSKHPNDAADFEGSAVHRSTRILSVAKSVAVITSTVCAAIQATLIESGSQLIIVGIVWLSSTLAALYCLKPSRYRRYPIQMLFILGFSFTNLGGALLIKTITLDPIWTGLEHPIAVFTTLLLAQTLLVASHFTYATFRHLHDPIANKLRQRILRPIGLFDMPRPIELWVMGIIGMLGIIFNKVLPTADSGVISHFLNATLFLTIAPFLLVARRHYGMKQSGTQARLLGTYLIGLILVGFMVNSRSLFLDAVMSSLLIISLSFSLGLIPIRSSSVFRGVGISLVILLSLPVVSGIADTMVDVRQYRTASTPQEMLKRTVDGMGASSDTSKVSTRFRDEIYINNPLFNRLITTKFHDIAITYSTDLSSAQRSELRQNSIERTLSILPQPILDRIGINIVKSERLYSNGDFLAYTANRGSLGGYRTGSMPVQGVAALGVLFIPIAFLLTLLCFFLYGTLTTLDRHTTIVSPLLQLKLWYVVGGVAGIGSGAEGLDILISGVFRVLPQSIAIYCVILWLTRRALRVTQYGHVNQSQIQPIKLP